MILSISCQVFVETADFEIILFRIRNQRPREIWNKTRLIIRCIFHINVHMLQKVIVIWTNFEDLTADMWPWIKKSLVTKFYRNWKDFLILGLPAILDPPSWILKIWYWIHNYRPEESLAICFYEKWEDWKLWSAIFIIRVFK